MWRDFVSAVTNFLVARNSWNFLHNRRHISHRKEANKAACTPISVRLPQAIGMAIPLITAPGTGDNTRSYFSYWLYRRCSCVRRQAPCVRQLCAACHVLTANLHPDSGCEGRGFCALTDSRHTLRTVRVPTGLFWQTALSRL
jgi:hypothetical protein